MTDHSPPTPKLCCDCVHFRTPSFGNGMIMYAITKDPSLPLCHRKVKEPASGDVNVITGRRAPPPPDKIRRCADERKWNSSDDCGWEARFYRERPRPPAYPAP